MMKQARFDMKNEVINADWRDILPRFKDKEFDLVVADPPYFSGPEKREYYGPEKSTSGIKRVLYPVTDDLEVPDEDYFQEVMRVSKNQIIWGVNYYKFNFSPGRIIWDKVNGDISFSDCEIAFCSMHDSVRIFRYMWNGMMQGESVINGTKMQGNKKLNEKRIHPTQKPVALYDWTFRRYARPGWKVLDTHVGSGSIRIAADTAGIDFLGIEKDPTHFVNQENRFKEYLKLQEIKRNQMKLFV